MPSIRYMNQSAPFWDFVASLENQGTSHPLFNANTGNNNRESDDSENEAPWGQWGPWGGWGGRFPHRGRSQRQPQQGDAPPAAAEQDNTQAPPPDYEGPAQPAASAGEDAGEGPSNARHPHPHPRGHPHHRHGYHGPGPDFRRGCRGPRGGWGGRHRGPPPFGPFGFGGFNGPFNPANIAEFVQSYLNPTGNTTNNNDNNNTAQDGPTAGSASDFRPAADVFDTETAFVVHISLPGAKKEDVGVSWDAERSEVVIGGVIYRPGDEEFLKTLALDERTEVGPFERKVRLGSRANPAQVDVDGITARLEDGILRVEVPKLDKDYVEIKKVDIE
ncbi:MAG: hypothetical protein M1821_010008 [Bathelium mastoideum]|nr:MAG: hypothetical protein M1821_010008 [Bathelium mastoideum]KAI9690221.1 MAG: hypothetical protein M1822_009182 [Bathelium mastoideum]